MKLLIDECLAREVAEHLAAVGHDAIHVSDRSLLGSPDEGVLAIALAEGRVLVSADTDFGELLARSGAALPSFVLLRRAGHRPSEQAAVLAANLPAIAADLDNGAVAVITNDRVRIRPLPIG